MHPTAGHREQGYRHELAEVLPLERQNIGQRVLYTYAVTGRNNCTTHLDSATLASYLNHHLTAALTGLQLVLMISGGSLIAVIRVALAISLAAPLISDPARHVR